MKKKIISSSLFALASLSASIYKGAYQFGTEIVYRERFYNEGSDERFQSLKIKNNRGLIMQGYLLEEENADRTLLVLHSFDQSSKDMVVYLPLFRSLFHNVNILFVDMVAHGNSDGYIRGFGYRDVIDLMYWNRYLLQRYGDDHSIIMYGKGQGANTILNAASLNKLRNVALILSEGAYDSVYHYLSYKFSKNIRTMNLIAPVIRRAILNETKMDIKKMDTSKWINNNNIPTIYIHSKNDKDVPFEMVFKLYNNNRSTKLLFPLKQEYLYELQGIDNEYLGFIEEFFEEV